MLRALQQQSASGDKNLLLHNPPQFRGLFFLPVHPLISVSLLLLSSASLTGFQPAPLLPPFLTTPDSSPSLCGTPSALSGLRYDIITASTTIIQQCGRIVAACGSTPPSAPRCRLSVSSAAALPPPSHRLPPSASFLPSPPANERASPRLPPPL